MRPMHAGGVRPLASIAVAAMVSCSNSVAAPLPPPIGQVAIRLEEVASGLSNPLHLSAPAGDARLFVVEQPGRVRVVRNGSLLSTSFLDISGRVRSGGEQGLLSVAFHPRFAQNGYFYVNYTDLNGDTRVERYTAAPGVDVAEMASAKLVLMVPQPFSNHNGGLVAFGEDGMLYIGMGDGGSSGDPQGHGQNRATLLGDLLRIDVDGGDPYSIPSDNPFRGTAGVRPEIWASGLRNPWRFAFDRSADMLYVADVGQNAWEEVNVVSSRQGGLNYGWNTMEGAHCFASNPCDQQELTLPALEYDHSEGCSVTGGYVYRGQRIPGLAGHYFYSDYCRGWIRSFRSAGGTITDRREWPVGSVGNVLSFGEDAAGELYILSANGKVYRIIPVSGRVR